MKLKLILGLLAISLFLISGCENVDISGISKNLTKEDINKIIVCESPYMRFESGCCLDQNNNKICDKDEGTSTNQPKEPSIGNNSSETINGGGNVGTIDYTSIFLSQKEFMQDLDNNIRSVITEGPGSRRTITLSLYGGELTVELDNTIIFAYKGDYKPTNVGETRTEGNLKILTLDPQTAGGSGYIISSTYNQMKLEINGGTISGQGNLIITNKGIDENKVSILITTD